MVKITTQKKRGIKSLFGFQGFHAYYIKQIIPRRTGGGVY